MAVKFRHLNPKALYRPRGYSHVVEATGPGRIVYIAGQLGLDREGNVVGVPGDFRAQAEQTFQNLREALAEVGADFNDVVKLNNYLVGIEHLGTLREVRDAHLNLSTPPASTTIAISDLAREGALIEIEAVAVLPAKAGAAKPAKTTTKTTTKTRRSAAKTKAKKAAPRKRK
jgi:enamine deaminase RidA (YjgF/YER057c/UK114 family)